MGRYYLMMIIAALILTAFAAIGMAMNVSKHPSPGTAASASYRSTMARSAGRLCNFIDAEREFRLCVIRMHQERRASIGVGAQQADVEDRQRQRPSIKTPMPMYWPGS